MIRAALLSIALCLGSATYVVAQEFTALARLDANASRITTKGGAYRLDLVLTQGVPYRVYTLSDPARLVLDFREVDWRGASEAALLSGRNARGVQFGGFRQGWSRMVIELAKPMTIAQVGMNIDKETGAARLHVAMTMATQDAFTKQAGAPHDPAWDLPLPEVLPELPPTRAGAGLLRIVLDAGHGGIDPGAERAGLNEADLMLRLSIEVADALNRSGGVRAILTRESDIFVPLDARMSIARAAGADLFISLHADALEEDEARGTSVYTLNAEGVDKAAARMAERHERGDLLAGLDLTGTDDRVATVLMDMARAETGPKGERFADQLVAAMRASGQRMNSKPRREGRLAVLNAADFASVLVEVGFLSNTADREALRSPAGRAPVVAGEKSP